MKIIEEGKPQPGKMPLKHEATCDGDNRRGCGARFEVDADDYYLHGSGRYKSVRYDCPCCGLRWWPSSVDQTEVEAHLAMRKAEAKEATKKQRRQRVRGWFHGPLEEEV